ncbi:MAG: LysM peptidoglycan-binding domain-containing protein [Crocinitomicaceae bacterium]|nr:LysM peptidoglycan-binding domain-containing protein [Crocinitomicaceae bacterium]MDG1657820.1 LysM peptidoglycan-binding domain-containing protein [Crocinitomicaceae bacterium]
MNKLLIIVLLALPMFASAQPGVSSVVEREGGKYYSHVVESGNTLWGIQQLFGVPVDEIVDANPELKSGLKEGQTIFIPVTQESIEKIPTTDYKVRKSETLYGLAKKFETTVDDLVALNPELKDGLKKGQIIQVPCSAENGTSVTTLPPVTTTPNPFVADTIENEDGSADHVTFSFSDSTVRHIVMTHETLYSVSKRFMVSVDKIMELNALTSTSIKEGQVLIIPVKTERIDRVEIRPVPLDYDPNGEGLLEFEKKDRYRIAVMLPFYLEGGAKYSKLVSELATQFYMGATMAVDSLEKLGLNANLEIFDTANDSLRILELLADTSFQSVDLVIGPFFPENMEIVSEYCKANRIRMVCPVAANEEMLDHNRLVYQAVPSGSVLMKRLAADMLKNNANDRIVLVKPVKESDILMYEAFKEEFNSALYDGVRPTLIESTVGGFTGQIRRGINTLFVIPATDRVTAMMFMNNLNKSAFRSRAQNLFVYGTKEWDTYSDINNMYKNKYNFHFPSPNFLDYYTDKMIAMNKLHRNWYKTDLSRMAVHGYDIVSHFCGEFFLESSKKPTMLMSAFEMNQSSPTGGYENLEFFIVEQDEYELFNSQVERND